jgi:hypothetical protein
VQNATTIEGAAAELAQLLEQHGFTVSEVGKAEEQNNPETTQVVNSYKEALPGQIAARTVLHYIPTAELYHSPPEESTESTESQITVVIGLDFPDDIQTGSLEGSN